MAMNFLEYLCQTCRMDSWGSSWQYFRQYNQLYTSVTGRYMDRNDTKEVQKVRFLPLPPLLPLATYSYCGSQVARRRLD